MIKKKKFLNTECEIYFVKFIFNCFLHINYVSINTKT